MYTAVWPGESVDSTEVFTWHSEPGHRGPSSFPALPCADMETLKQAPSQGFWFPAKETMFCLFLFPLPCVHCWSLDTYARQEE